MCDQVGAMDQLRLAKVYGENWATHTVSCTTYYTDDTWFDACSWMWHNWDSLIGMSFLPHDGGTYQQAPYESISKAQYNQLVLCSEPTRVGRAACIRGD